MNENQTPIEREDASIDSAQNPLGNNQTNSGNATSSTLTDQSNAAYAIPTPTTSLPSEDVWILTNWKTSVGFSLLGFLGYLVFWMILIAVIGITINLWLGPASSIYPVDYTGITAGAIAAFITGLLTILYAVLGYNSYFTKKPLLKDSRAISFFNFFFGNIIFGALWNYNLTNSRKTGVPMKGVSYIVCIILSALSLLSCGSQLITSDIPYLNYLKDYYYYQEYSNTSTSSTNNPQDKTLVFPNGEDIDVSFTVPQGWKSTTLPSNAPKDVQCILTPNDTPGKAVIYYMVTDIFGSASKEFQNTHDPSEINTSFFDKEYILEYGKGYITDIARETAEKVTVNGNDYWFSYVSGTTDDVQISDTFNKEEVPLTEIDYRYYKDGYAYLFLLTSFTTDEEATDYQKSLEELIESVNYEYHK